MEDDSSVWWYSLFLSFKTKMKQTRFSCFIFTISKILLTLIFWDEKRPINQYIRQSEFRAIQSQQVLELFSRY
jgi:hypothetical protein